jgi:hypothetical protein
LATQRSSDKDGVVSATELPAHVERFVRGAGLIPWDPEVLGACRLDGPMSGVLRVAAVLEADTSISARQARALGLDRAQDLAAFLPVWEAEEAEHGRALRRLVEDLPGSSSPARPARIAARRRGQALVPLRVLGRVRPVGTVFCTLAAAAEYVAIVIYDEMARVADDPDVVALLRSVIHQEGRHLAFFLAAAKLRAGPMSDLEGRVARRLMTASWTPVGMASLGADRWWTTIGPLLERPPVRRRVRRMDRVVDAVPHLSGLELMGSFLGSHPPVGGPPGP